MDEEGSQYSRHQTLLADGWPHADPCWWRVLGSCRLWRKRKKVLQTSKQRLQYLQLRGVFVSRLQCHRCVYQCRVRKALRTLKIAEHFFVSYTSHQYIYSLSWLCCTNDTLWPKATWGRQGFICLIPPGHSPSLKRCQVRSLSKNLMRKLWREVARWPSHP